MHSLSCWRMRTAVVGLHKRRDPRIKNSCWLNRGLCLAPRCGRDTSSDTNKAHVPVSVYTGLLWLSYSSSTKKQNKKRHLDQENVHNKVDFLCRWYCYKDGLVYLYFCILVSCYVLRSALQLYKNFSDILGYQTMNNFHHPVTPKLALPLEELLVCDDIRRHTSVQ